MTVILFPLRIQLDHGINTHDSYASFDGTLQLLHLAHAGLQDTSLQTVVDSALHQIQAVVPVGLLLGDGLLFLVGIALLDALGDGVADSQLGNEFGRVLGCVDS